MKTRPNYPTAPFVSIEAATVWVDAFVTWYNGKHRNSPIGFVAPNQRHCGKIEQLLAKRRCLRGGEETEPATVVCCDTKMESSKRSF
tara:strand:+ start:25413 stop:25673 length:261 start_codon:yes stop_codon:yes gene_type:complete